MDRPRDVREFHQGDTGDETKREPKPEAKSPLERLNNVPDDEYPEPNG